MENTTVVEDNFTLEDQASKIIAKAAAKASGLAALPIPLVDVIGSAYIQSDMINKIGDLFGISSIDTYKHVWTSIATSVLGKLATESFSNLIESTEIEKVISRSLVSATIAGFLTTVTGEIFFHHYKRGGNLNNFKFTAYSDYITAQIESDRLSIQTVGNKVVEEVISSLS